MVLFEITGTEGHSVYRALEISNGNRQYDFLRSIVVAAVEIERPFLSQTILKALNFHAIACLHTHAGEYRPCPVVVGEHSPPEHYRITALMDDLVNTVNRRWGETDPVFLCCYVLWQINYIHPFINGNGRTARAASYFTLCVALRSWLPGETILPELLRRNRPEYVRALQHADLSATNGSVDLRPLHSLVSRLLAEQLGSGDVMDPMQPHPSA
jgi:hypothetical protein